MDLNKLEEGLEEIVTEKEFKEIAKKPSPTSYWGVAPSGAPHLGYYRAIEKQKHFIEEGFNHKILIADLHAFLDDKKSPWEELDKRSKIYQKSFELLGLKDCEFIRGSDFQKSNDYIEDLYKAIGNVTANRAERSASEVVRGENPTVGSLTYPIMQNLDVVHLNADVALGGIDQRHVYMLGRELLPKIGYKKPTSVFFPLGKGLKGKKMSASKKKTKISLLEGKESIFKKIESSYCPKGKIEDNPIIDYIEHFIFSYEEEFEIDRAEKYGGNLKYTNKENFLEDYSNNKIHPADLKPATASYIYKILSPIREYFREEKELLKTYNT